MLIVLYRCRGFVLGMPKPDRREKSISSRDLEDYLEIPDTYGV